MNSCYNREGLVNTLAEDFGIKSPKELDNALKNSQPLDISLFVCKANPKQISKQNAEQRAC